MINSAPSCTKTQTTVISQLLVVLKPESRNSTNGLFIKTQLHAFKFAGRQICRTLLQKLRFAAILYTRDRPNSSVITFLTILTSPLLADYKHA